MSEAYVAGVAKQASDRTSVVTVIDVKHALSSWFGGSAESASSALFRELGCEPSCWNSVALFSGVVPVSIGIYRAPLFVRLSRKLSGKITISRAPFSAFLSGILAANFGINVSLHQRLPARLADVRQAISARSILVELRRRLEFLAPLALFGFHDLSPWNTNNTFQQRQTQWR